MRKFLLMAVVAAVVQVSNAQAPTSAAKPRLLRNNKVTARSNEDRPVVALPQGNATNTHALPHNNSTNKNAKAYHALNTIKIGSAGNLLTVSNVGCNQVSVNPLNLVSFIHRTDNTLDATTNISEYSYDFSKDNGASWTSNVGPITNQLTIINDGTGPHGRFPQALIYNPLNNLLADSAYLVYSGTWHDAPVSGTTGTWVGQLVGRGQFTGDNSTFNAKLDTINNGVTDIATGLCQGAPGVFWAVNQDWTGTFSTTSNDITNGIIVEKGVWNTITKDVDWTASEIHQRFDSFVSGTVTISAAQSFNIAFDPTGQLGWISCIGDITDRTRYPANDSVFRPIFWKTTDGGNTWSNAISVYLDSLPGVVEALDSVTIYSVSGGATGAFTSQVPTTAFESALAVDYAGNPHFFTTVGNGNSYSIESGAGYRMYDITLNPADTGCRQTNNGWAAIFVDSVATLRGNTTTDATPLTDDNHPLATRTPDGKRVYFLWEASDPSYNLTGDPQGDDNTFRNLFVRGFDVVHSTSTKAVNLTEGDANWGAPDSLYPTTGTYGAPYYPEISPIVIVNGTTDNIPLTLTQIAYTTNSGASDDPAQFYYINNINFSQFDFVNGISATLSPIGTDTVIVVKGGTYSDQGATINYLDTACSHSGALHIVTNGSGLDVNTPGTYYVYYAAEDGSGNIYANGQRVVLVVSAPVANFVYAPTQTNLTIQFTDSSLYSPTSWAWTFGDGGSDAVQNPNHPFATAGSYNVCLTASNAYGTSAQVCKTINVVSGINQIDFSSTVNVFPNPTNGNTSITLSGNSIPDFTVSVYNVLGEQVIATSEYKSGTTNVQLNANSLASGVYLVKLQSNQGSAIKRLTVAHNK